MNLGCAHDFIIFYFIVFYIIIIIITQIYNYLQLLINFEFIWIAFYILCIIISFLYNDIIFLGLIFFLLIFSAIELSIGFILVTIQYHLYNNIIFKSKLNKSFFKYKTYYSWHK